MKDRDLRKALETHGYIEQNELGIVGATQHPEARIYWRFGGAEGLREALLYLKRRQDALAEALGYEFVDEPEQPARTVCKKKPAARRTRK